MYDRKGSFLEKTVAGIFDKAGFRTKVNHWVKGYEVDVFASKGSYNIAIECKQYERSHLPIRNILHQWASKNSIINVDKVILVVAGQRPSCEDYLLAKKLNIVLLNDNKVHYLNSLIDIERLNIELNDLIGFDKDLSRNRQIKKLIMVSIGALFIVLAIILAYDFLKILFQMIVVSLLVAIIFLAILKSKKRRRRRL